jgi:heat shock protein HslJ
MAEPWRDDRRQATVSTPFARTALATALIALLVAACGGSGGSASPLHEDPPCCPATLAGTNWGVVSVAGRPSVPASTPFIGFTADRVQGTGGCNSFGGAYTYDPTTGALTLGELMMTLMGCIGPQGDFETVFVNALQGPQQVMQTADGSGDLVFEGPKGRIVLAPAARDLSGG